MIALKYFILISLLIAGLCYYAYKIIGNAPATTAAHQDSAVPPATDTLSPSPDSLQSAAQPLHPWTAPAPLSQIVSFAETLQGVPYLYASSDPAKGFDCSGFITYVFNHFGLEVPRSSVDFTDKGIAVPLVQARRGDLILFTGTDSASGVVGHMGIVTENSDSLRFIHSSSGKANGVTITALNEYYLSRFVKVISVKDGL